ncbi:hypothetical protein RJ641_006481 [Dillenia turbinata]|uniref:Uncharacterized protein n=1 Tax=Dillenia turbinata TaxID=194707 RepID=A0AAN8V5K9_9MAGN
MSIATSCARVISLFSLQPHHHLSPHLNYSNSRVYVRRKASASPIRLSYEVNPNGKARETLRTCKNCKTQFDPLLNHPMACRFHSAHFGGETKRKFESVYTGGTMDTPDSGKVFEYWHCCGSEDPFDPGCTAAPHMSYDD